MQEQASPPVDTESEPESPQLVHTKQFLVVDRKGRFAYGRKLRRIQQSWARRQARAERRAAHRALKMLRISEGVAPWRVESNELLVDTMIDEGFLTEDQREQALEELRRGR